MAFSTYTSIGIAHSWPTS